MFAAVRSSRKNVVAVLLVVTSLIYFWSNYKPNFNIAKLNCPLEYMRRVHTFVECHEDLCNRDIAVGVLFSKATSLRYEKGSLKSWTKWAGRMKVEFYGAQTYPSIPTMHALNVPERNDSLVFELAVQMWKDLFKQHENCKWFLKLDDDAFLLAPNLLRRLSGLDPTQPIFGGKQIFNYDLPSGGAGYFFSRAALEQLAPNLDQCIQDVFSQDGYSQKEGAPEDVFIARCARKYIKGLATINVPGMYANNPVLAKTNWLNFSPEGLYDYPLTFHYMYEEESLKLEMCSIHD